MLTSLLFAVAALAPAGDTLYCPIMMEAAPAMAKAKAVEYAGLYVAFCCGGCDATFSKDPEAHLKKAESSDKPVAMGWFDPITGQRIDGEKAKGQTVYKGVRYYFATDEGLKKFKASPATYAARPAKQSLNCPKSGELIASYSEAAGYRDYKGVRYYICCASCFKSLEKSMGEAVAKNPGQPAAPKAMAYKPH
ncbi:MAG: YHS domain-containing protein [Fimbriimonadaceae bacterium]|nr:YHS domain-containing protein [Fimbriimonadaceae bacterium]QYK55293.1 MAG: YHS domain-containing protein [Fimbriimonadaceae bacterium]